MTALCVESDQHVASVNVSRRKITDSNSDHAIRIEPLSTVSRCFTKIHPYTVLSNPGCYKPTNKQTNIPRYIVTSVKWHITLC